MPVARRCLTCGSVFTTLSSLREHCSSNSHSSSPYICNPCNQCFGNIRALQNHLNSRKHADDPVVGLSVGSFTDRQDDSHSRTAERFDKKNQDIDNFCSACYQAFESAKSLEQHTASLAHSARVLKCPFCNFKFKSPSGMVMHLEDSCKSKITRHQVTAAVHSMGFTLDISIDRYIEGIRESSERGLQMITTSNPNASTTSQLFATEASFNGSYYECPFVKQCLKKKFHNLGALNRHLNSPAHDESQFKCPGCRTEFKLISGFIQHVESRICVQDTGSAAFEQIEIQIRNLAGFFADKLVINF